MKFQSAKPLESGFFVPFNVKDMQPIQLKDKLGILVSSNDDSLRVFTTIR